MFLVEGEHCVYVSEKDSTNDEVVIVNWKTQVSTPLEEWSGIVHSCTILTRVLDKQSFFSPLESSGAEKALLIQYL